MKKICIITTISSTMESFVIETAKKIYKDLGWEVTLICDTDEVFAKSLPDYLRYIPVPMKRGIDLSAYKTIRAFKEIFKKEKFDIVQYATPNASFYASIASKKAKIKNRVYCQWGIRYVGFSGLKRILFKLLEKKTCKNSTKIYAVSPLNKAFAVKEKLYKENKAKVIGNGGTIGVDTNIYDVNKKDLWRKEIRQKYGLCESDFVYGFVGRLSVDKGAKELVNAFKGVIDKENAKLMIIGPLEGSVDAELVDYIKTSNNVVVTGEISNSKMQEYYPALDVLVHPTYREGFGMVIQEAGALAVPTITTKIAGASEVMLDGESCLLVEPKNTKELQNVMLLLKNDSQLLLKLGKGALDRTLKLYERQIMLENQLKAYKEFLDN